ncbi:M23 family metallopeptidase [Wandonia haliotis]|uniref:M23 family metallopeptidase n=1 Tax=Wandonia haliotis TaxID=574963 RepID=A0ABP3Y845_9FLAO
MKKKFVYNPKTLSYERVRRTWGERVLRGLIFIAPTITLGIILAFFIARRIDSPRETRLRQENEFYKAQLDKMTQDLELITKALDEMEKRDRAIYRVAFNAEAFPEELRRMGVGGSEKYKELEGKKYSELLIATNKKIDEVERRLYAQSLSLQELSEIALDKEARLASIPAIQPVRNKDMTRVASGYGWRIDPVYKTRRMHWGMDFTAPVGTEVYSTGDGVVEELEIKSWGYGKSIVIDHGYGYKTRYAHLSAFKVKKGDKVKRGDLIGLIGNSGKSTGPHLHYEVEHNGQKINPVGYYHGDLSPEEYEQMIQLSNNALNAFD